MIARGGGPMRDPILFVALALLVYAFLTGGIAAPLRNAERDPMAFVGFIVAIVLGITVHEFMHAYTAHRLGDDTARLLGRLTLNPLAHFDIFGTLLLVLAGFGYGKPVPVNEARLRGAFATSMVSLAGPLSNFALAAVCAIPLRLAGPDALPAGYVTVLLSIVFYNCVLGLFNLIPIPPLDGSRVVYGLLPPRLQWSWRTYEQYGPFLLLALLLLGGGILSALVFGPARMLTALLVGS